MDHRLRAWVREDFGVELTSVEPVEHGADAAAEVRRGLASDGAGYAVKWSGGGTPVALLVAARLAECGVPGVLAPVATRAGRLWSEHDGRRLSLVPWAPGIGALDGELTARRWRRYGALLAQVHATPPSDAVLRTLPREPHDPERWAAPARALGPAVEAAAADAGATADPLVRALAEQWRGGAAAVVAALLDRADALGRVLRAQQATEVVCHGDPHLLNVLVSGDEDVWLIDWDDAVLAPRERDLMFVLGGVLPFAPVGAQEQAWFFDGYGPVDVDPDRLAYYRCVRALEDLAGPAEEVLDVGGRGDRQRADALGTFSSVLSPTGLARLVLGGTTAAAAAQRRS
ncbi:phosphotransferase enzyme family protein [Conexibacter woesei]|uniref:phosphotransferase enzyme family protein n=1 Tax=Conexibacter woesei TaxID=191495 RepID=UPI00191782FD|nr:phosphotransferase [Conexibacter woesei]